MQILEGLEKISPITKFALCYGLLAGRRKNFRLQGWSPDMLLGLLTFPLHLGTSFGKLGFAWQGTGKVGKRVALR